ncbi:MAG: hypothetical protein H3C34_16335 [Caldilineaceae bacterium]|nr:hypothetical protein [Caldilineaceae bacterium]
MVKRDKELPLYTQVDDETYDELVSLAGQQLVYVAVWEDSLASVLQEDAQGDEEQDVFDIDLYLEDGVYFELYSVACFDSPDDESWRGLDSTTQRLTELVRRQTVLAEVAVDENDCLVLVLRAADGTQVFLAVAAWLLEEWDELPDA